ncbi:hypothetical protein A4A49_62496, partial [Nicotiana attenuata]
MEVLDRFSGSANPESWLFRAERYFTYLSFVKKDWFPLSSFYLDGEALKWFNWLFQNKQFFSWTHFKAKFAQHFRQQSAIYSVRCFVGSSHVRFDYINIFPIVSQSAMVSPFPVSSLFPKTSAFEAAYETENSKADHMFDSCYANASFQTKVHTEVLDDTTGSDDGEEENSRDYTIAGVFDKFPQWDTLDFLGFTSQGTVVSNAIVRFDVIEFPFDGTIWFGTIPWLSSYLEDIGGANQNQMSRFGLHKCNWVDTAQERNFPGFLLSKSRESAREQKRQRGLHVLAESYFKQSPHIRMDKATGLLFSLFGLVHKASYVDKWFDTRKVFKVALGRVDMIVAHNGNCIKSCAMYKLLGESIADSFMCSFDDATTQIEEQYIIDQLRSFSSGRALELSALHHALTFTMVLWISETINIGVESLEFVVAITTKHSLGFNSTFSIPCDLVMFDIHKFLNGYCYQLLAGQSKLLCPQLGLGMAQCLEVIPCFLSANNHDQLLHR